jgi:hypothetical protein
MKKLRPKSIAKIAYIFPASIKKVESQTASLIVAQSSFFGSGKRKKFRCSMKWIKMIPAIAIPLRISATSIRVFGLSDGEYAIII